MKRILLATACATALGLAALPGRAAPFDTGIATLAEKIAEALSVHGMGRDGRVAEIYVRPPFDDAYRVVCAPLSRRLARALRAELPEAFARKRLTGARTVQRQGDGEGQLILNVSWRQSGAEKVEIGFLLGDLSKANIPDVGGGAVHIDQTGLGGSERACLVELDVINRLETAPDTLFIHRSADVFSAEIGFVPKGQRFRLLGRMPYTDGEWAVVKMLDAENGPFSETVGFASLPSLAISGDNPTSDPGSPGSGETAVKVDPGEQAIKLNLNEDAVKIVPNGSGASHSSFSLGQTILIPSGSVLRENPARNDTVGFSILMENRNAIITGFWGEHWARVQDLRGDEYFVRVNQIVPH